MRNPTLHAALILYMTFFMAACDHNSVVASGHQGNLSYQVIEFTKQGGKECPETLGQPLSNTQADSSSLCASVSFSYPVINSSTQPALAARLNNYISEQLLDEFSPEDDNVNHLSSTQKLEKFAEAFINDYQQNLHTFTSWELERKASIAFINDELITLAFTEYGFTGGAHPFSGVRYSVLSLAEGKLITLADLLKPNFETPLNVEGEKAFRKMRGLSELTSLDEHGFSFINNTFQLNNNFAITEKGLLFFFNNYEIGPYAIGSTEVLVNYEDIKEIIRPEGLLAQWAD